MGENYKKIPRVFNYKFDKKDERDWLYTVPRLVEAVPSKFDTRSIAIVPVYNQLTLGACTAFATTFDVEYNMYKQKIHPSFMPSQLFQYYNELIMDGDPLPLEDNGSSLRTGIKCLAKWGVCTSADWPYIPSKFNIRPSIKAYNDALKSKAIQYYSVAQNLLQLQTCLSGGFPVVFGFTVYQSFESDAVAATGIVPMPKARETSIGGHAVALVGYDNAKQWFIVRNSWGVDWGALGYCYIPYAYLLNPNLADDYWTIRRVGS
jgi:C1A family cysteine protease